ncbi:GNAT family N-acetyltransferase [Nocardioides sp. InS609-2]|uniref:GNAT family N-acetyltransferase n=1 Tax=Nocardioides sp. InS609-2 TaxID=2760705 RepID=UPI0020C12105|nr:GNAT family N-acetyltransferase [Nocardioides sp. InS609-2]
MSEAVRRRYLEVNGDHPMFPNDDHYVREHFVPANDEVLALIEAGSLPLPSYYLSDGTPMVPADVRDPISWAGGVERLHDWFVGHWTAEEQATAESEWGDYLSGQYVCLRDVQPVRMQQKTQHIEQIRAAIAVLEQHPGDHVARGSLGEAVERLEQIELPMTDYDRLRFGGPLSPEVWIHDVRRDHLLPKPPELPIRTERLVLRETTAEDTEVLLSYYGNPDVAYYTLMDAWTPGYAAFRARTPAVSTKLSLAIDLDGRMVGDVVLMFQGPSYSQAEIGWALHPDVFGRGIATEAARAAIDLLFGHYGMHRVNAQLDARNDASARLCERLGMRRESHKLRDFWSKGEWTDSFEYAVLAEEWRG